MTAVDDLKVGQWIALTYVENPQVFMFFGGQPMANHPQVDGVPLEVMAISLPFVCVSNGRFRFSIDVRRCRFQRVSRRYVDLMFNMEGLTINGIAAVEDDLAEVPVEEVESNPRACPMCGERMVERLDPDTRDWFVACRQCGFQGTIPKDNGEV